MFGWIKKSLTQSLSVEATQMIHENEIASAHLMHVAMTSGSFQNAVAAIKTSYAVTVAAKNEMSVSNSLSRETTAAVVKANMELRRWFEKMNVGKASEFDKRYL